MNEILNTLGLANFFPLLSCGLSKIGEIIGKFAEKMKNDLIDKNPLKRLVEPIEIAEVVLFISLFIMYYRRNNLSGEKNKTQI